MRPTTQPPRPHLGPRSLWLFVGLSALLMVVVNGVAFLRMGGGSLARPRRAGPTTPAPAALFTSTSARVSVPVFQPMPAGVGQGAPLPVTAGFVGDEGVGEGDEGDPVSSSSNPNPAASPPSSRCTARPAFVRYEPSPWEAEWAARLAGAPANASFCEAARADGDRAARLLAWTAATRSNDSSTSAPPPPPPPDLLSSLVYTCATSTKHKNATWAEPIEPLVGLLRHPYAVPACTPPSGRSVHIEDRAYLVLRRPQGPPPSTPSSQPPRALLFDAGANSYASSLGWLVESYAALGLNFDAIYAWEAALPLNSTWWAEVPLAIAPRLHAYNAPVALGSAMDPVAWMRSLVRPGDLVVFKLDVGSGQTERAFVDDIAGSWGGGENGAPPYVLEFFYEFHYSEPALAPWFGPAGPDTLSLADAAVALTKMRESGVRAHYWP
jgi:hypothetical protein